MTKNYQMYVDGAFSDAGDGQRSDSINPAAEEASAAIVEFARIMHAAGLPEGVFNVVTGGGKAYRKARAIPAVRFWINTYRATNYAMPFGGSGNSGYGREGGVEAIHDHSQSKANFCGLLKHAGRRSLCDAVRPV